MSMFGTSATDNYDGLSIPSLPPAKYEGVILEDVKAEALKKADGTVGKFAIKFFFKTADGEIHQHTEYELTTQDNGWEKKLANMKKRIGHIMSKFMPKEELAQQSETFQAYANWVVSKIKATPYKEVLLDILIVGNVYQGKTKSEFTGYPPFLAKSGDPLQFDNNAIAANKAYYAHMAKQSGEGLSPDGAQGGQANPGYSSAGQTTTNDF